MRHFHIDAVGVVFVVAGIFFAGFAERISSFERRLAEKYPITRVTGWSGTRKGIMYWRVLGLVWATLGLVWVYTFAAYGK